MYQPELDHEEQWIAKYRAALAASPRRRVSLLDHFVTRCQNLSEKLAIRFRHTLGNVQDVVKRCGLGKGWITSIPTRRLRRQS